MAESFTFSECEFDYMGEGYDPSMAAEICADVEGQRPEDEKEESIETEIWEYWLG
jgi:hypothetical protein